MGLNIKDERVHELVREAAKRTQMSQTRVVEVAIQRVLDQLSDEVGTSRAEVRALLADIDARLTEEQRVLLDVADLYDDDGMPK